MDIYFTYAPGSSCNPHSTNTAIEMRNIFMIHQRLYSHSVQNSIYSSSVLTLSSTLFLISPGTHLPHSMKLINT